MVHKAVKDLFEDASVTKIIHDCRMDCDALYHLHRIQVNNVHDTSCFHGVEDSNLNDVLSYNGIMINKSRDKTVYKRNPRFWAARPLTATMVDWDSSDVQNLFALADAQLNRITTNGLAKSAAIAKSSQYSRIVCNMKVCPGLTVRNPGSSLVPVDRTYEVFKGVLGLWCTKITKLDGWYFMTVNLHWKLSSAVCQSSHVG